MGISIFRDTCEGDDEDPARNAQNDETKGTRENTPRTKEAKEARRYFGRFAA